MSKKTCQYHNRKKYCCMCGANSLYLKLLLFLSLFLVVIPACLQKGQEIYQLLEMHFILQQEHVVPLWVFETWRPTASWSIFILERYAHTFTHSDFMCKLLCCTWIYKLVDCIQRRCFMLSMAFWCWSLTTTRKVTLRPIKLENDFCDMYMWWAVGKCLEMPFNFFSSSASILNQGNKLRAESWIVV